MAGERFLGARKKYAARIAAFHWYSGWRAASEAQFNQVRCATSTRHLKLQADLLCARARARGSARPPA